MNWTERVLGRTRGQLLGLLRRSKRSINEIADAVGISDHAVRTHLAEMQQAAVEHAAPSRDAVYHERAGEIIAKDTRTTARAAPPIKAEHQRACRRRRDQRQRRPHSPGGDAAGRDGAGRGRRTGDWWQAGTAVRP